MSLWDNLYEGYYDEITSDEEWDSFLQEDPYPNEEYWEEYGDEADHLTVLQRDWFSFEEGEKYPESY